MIFTYKDYWIAEQSTMLNMIYWFSGHAWVDITWVLEIVKGIF
jgi:hypothetical protein